MKNLFYLLGIMFVLSIATTVHAQDGCVNSPENPTAVLALVGSAGGLVVAGWNRLRRSK